MMAILIVVLFFVAMIVIAVAVDRSYQNTREKLNKKIDEFMESNDFKPDKQYRPLNVMSAIGLNYEKKLIFIANDKGNPKDSWGSMKDYFDYDYEYEFIPFTDLIGVELIQDGSTINHTQRGSQITGAVVGGIVAGGVGAVIGGLSGSTKTTENIHEIYLRLVVNDKMNPVRYVRFFKDKKGMSKRSIEQINKDAFEWFALLDKVIKIDD